MKFNTKDLMISVNPAQAKFCALHTTICFSPTLQCFNHSCGFVTCGFFSCRYVSTNCFECSIAISRSPGGQGCGVQNSCGPGNSACDFTQVGCPGSWYEIGDMGDLVTLKDELTAVLKQLEVVQKEGLPGQIRTKADAEQMEAALTTALEQVRAEKKNLK
ncbi:MAG: hypothetical protein ABJE47_05150 [bacterium]